MSTKKNAAIALKELGKMVGIEGSEEQETVAGDYSQPSGEYAPGSNLQDSSVFATYVRKSHTVIDSGTIITGNITTDGDITCDGVINGNIDCKGGFVCRGQVEGEVSGETINLIAARVVGNINAKGSVAVDANTTVIGSVTASDITLDGRLKGDLHISGATKLEPNAILVGDINTDRLAMSDGSRFSGRLSMTNDLDLDSIFK